MVYQCLLKLLSQAFGMMGWRIGAAPRVADSNVDAKKPTGLGVSRNVCVGFSPCLEGGIPADTFDCPGYLVWTSGAAMSWTEEDTVPAMR